MLFNSRPSEEAITEACKYIARMFQDKQAFVDAKERDKAATFLSNNPEYLYELGYEEKVEAPMFGEKFQIRQWFRDLAADDKLKTITPEGYLAVNDLAIVREIQRRGENALFHKGKPFPYCVEGEGRKSKIVKYSRALQKRTGGVTGKAFLSRTVADTSVNAPEVDNFIASVQESKENEQAKLQAELAKLRAENARLSAREVTTHEPLVQSSNINIAPPVSNQTIQ
jgi:hypothetical protein